MTYTSPLYRPQFEHDACGIGAVVDIKGRRSYGTVDNALEIVEKLEHRAGKDAAGETGDGVGILLQIPHRLLSRWAEEQGLSLGEERDYGVGMFFFPQDKLKRAQAKKMLEIIVDKEGMDFLGWRDVPVHPEVLGQKALDCMPRICQCFVKRPADCPRGLDFDRKLYVVRRTFEQSNVNTYIPSFSSRTIVYKGMFLVGQLRQFYADLTDPDCESAIALVHSRFSTNTTPSWERAHPNRYILHNGEINTIRGNVDRMLAREETISSPLMDDDMDKILPVVDQRGSDSAMLDNTLEFLMMNGVELPQAVMMCIPEPWANDKRMDREKRDFYHYYATMMEPWDGPAAIVFSDGDAVGAVLDRNGLRPCRWYLTDDEQLILSSEVGVLDIPPEKIVKKSRLQPGRMLLADLRQGRLVDDSEIKQSYAVRQPYGEWLDAHLVHLRELPIPNRRVETHPQAVRDRLYKAFGYTYEEIKDSVLPMARDGMEPTSAMGVDTPLAVLSERHQPLFNYFKQLFAQVTNPPIDAIREEIVTDTTVYVGPSGNLLEEKASNCTVLQIPNPILTSVELMKIRYMDRSGFHVETVSLLYYKGSPLENALGRLVVNVDRAYKKGANILILSDRGVDENHAAIPSLLAVSTLEQYLVRTKKRTAVSMVLESAEPRDVHHFATLLGYGAQAINPYLAQECVEELVERGLLDKDKGAAVSDYDSAILHGIVKIASKMGISTIQSYQSAQIFEIVGINRAVVDKYFTNTISRVEGVGLEEIGEGVEWNHSQAFDPLGLGFDTTLDSMGAYRLRSGGDKEDHMYNPQTILLLQKAAREGSYETFKEYTALVDFADKPHTLRGLLDFRIAEDGGIPIDEVEPVESIVRRFKTGAMSYGSISQEAHECLAVAMNRIGGKSNSGEGGESRERPAVLRHQAGGLGPLRRDGGVSGVRSGDPDQDGPRGQARRGRTPAGEEGLPLDRQDPVLHPRRQPYLAPAPPRHLFHRRSGPTDLRPEERQSPGQDQRQAGQRGRRGHHRGGRCKGRGPGGPHLRPRRRHRRGPPQLHHRRGPALGAGGGGGPPDVDPERPALPGGHRGRRKADDRAGCGHRLYAGGGGVRLRHRAPGDHGVLHDAGVQPGHLSGGYRHPGPGAAQTLRGKAGVRGQLHDLRGPGAAGVHGEAGHPDGG